MKPLCPNHKEQTTVHAHNIRARMPVNRLVLSPRHRQAFPHWTLQHLLDRVHMVYHPQISDESPLISVLWWSCYQRYHAACVKQLDRWGGASVRIVARRSGRGFPKIHIVSGNFTAVRYHTFWLQQLGYTWLVFVLPFSPWIIIWICFLGRRVHQM